MLRCEIEDLKWLRFYLGKVDAFLVKEVNDFVGREHGVDFFSFIFVGSKFEIRADCF